MSHRSGTLRRSSRPMRRSPSSVMSPTMSLSKNATLREKQRQRSLARAQVRNDQRRHEIEEHLRKALPTSARYVVAAEAARELIEVSPQLVFAFPRRAGAPSSWADLAISLPLPKRSASITRHPSGLPTIEAFLAGAPHFDKARLLQLRKLHRDAALAHREDFLNSATLSSSPGATARYGVGLRR